MKDLIFISNNKIDFDKWNNCIINSVKPKIYALSTFLNAVHSNWDAYVYGDYEYVFPITKFTKWGIKYLAQPTYTYQLGIFSSENNPKVIALFIKKMTSDFKLIELRVQNDSFDPLRLFNAIKLDNFCLPLNHHYDYLSSNYSKSHKKNIRRADKNNLIIEVNNDVKEYVQFYSENVPGQVHLTPQNILQLKSICMGFLNEMQIKIYWVKNEKGTPLACACFLFGPIKRITYNSSSNDLGKDQKALFMLLDQFIKDHAEQNIELDFAGSSIESIAYFFKGFGADHEIFYEVKHNGLPWPVKLFKK